MIKKYDLLYKFNKKRLAKIKNKDVGYLLDYLTFS